MSTAAFTVQVPPHGFGCGRKSGRWREALHPFNCDGTPRGLVYDRAELHATSSVFPSTAEADEHGLVAVSAEMDLSLLIDAYCNGIFPGPRNPSVGFPTTRSLQALASTFTGSYRQAAASLWLPLPTMKPSVK